MLYLKTNQPFLKMTAEQKKTEEDSGYPYPIDMVGYTGAAMEGWYEPIVISLTGMSIEERLPLLLEHKRELLAGKISEVSVGPGLNLKGEIFNTPAGNTIMGGKSIEYQASVGIMPDKIKYIPEGESVLCNSQSFEGPITVIETSTLHEISAVLWGRDDSTSIECSAEIRRRFEMERTSEQQAADEPPKEITAAATPPPVEVPVEAPVIAATLAELQKEFTDPQFILDCFSAQKTLLQCQQEHIAAEKIALAKDREALELARVKQEAPGADPIPRASTFNATTPQGGSITMSSMTYPPCAEPYQTEEDMKFFGLYGSTAKIHGDFSKSHGNWDHIGD